MAMDVLSAKDVESVVTVKRQFSRNVAGKTVKMAPDEKPEVMRVHRFITEPAKVSYSLGRTINLGDFESVRIDVRMEVPTYKEELREAYEFAKTTVSAIVKLEVDKVTLKTAKKKKKGEMPF